MESETAQDIVYAMSGELAITETVEALKKIDSAVHWRGPYRIFLGLIVELATGHCAVLTFVATSTLRLSCRSGVVLSFKLRHCLGELTVDDWSACFVAGVLQL